MRLLRVLLAALAAAPALAAFSPLSAAQKAAVPVLAAPRVSVRTAAVPQLAVAPVPIVALVQAQAVSAAFAPERREVSPQTQAQEASRRFDGHFAAADAADAPAVSAVSPAAPRAVPYALVAHAASELARHHIERPRVERLLSKAMRGLLEKGGARTYEAAMPHFRALREALTQPALGPGFEWSKRYTGPARVEAVHRGSPAHAAGLLPGDTITAVDGRELATLAPHAAHPLLTSGARRLTIFRNTSAGPVVFDAEVAAGLYRQPDFSRLMRGITLAFANAAAAVAPGAGPALLDAALTRMASSLDKYTEYMNPEAAAEFARHYTRPIYDGFGFQTRHDDRGALVVGGVLPGSPAARAGLTSGDRLAAIDGRPAGGLLLEQASELMRREVGASLTLELEKADGRRTSAVLTAEALELPLAGAAMLPGKVGYVYLSMFSNVAVENALTLIRTLRMEGAEKLVVDLRFNPGGQLESAVELAGAFLRVADPVTKLTYAARGPSQAVAMGDGAFADMRVAIVVNGASASASELFTGALRGNGRAVVVGQATFGKGVGQESHPLLDGSILKITAFRWHMPGGRALAEGDGIRPDVPVAADEQAKRTSFLALQSGLFEGRMPGLEDPAIKAAWDALGGKAD